MRFARVGDDCIRLRWHFPLATPYKILTLITPSKGASHVIYVMCSSYLPMYPTLSFRLGFRTHLLFLPASTPFTTSAWSPFYRFLLSTPSQRRYTSNMKPTCCHLVSLGISFRRYLPRSTTATPVTSELITRVSQYPRRCFLVTTAVHYFLSIVLSTTNANYFFPL